MGNQVCSSKQHIDRVGVVRKLWKAHRAVPVLPINPSLDSLRVLTKKSDAVFHDVGSVYSLCKPGKDKEWLRDVLYPQRTLHHLLPSIDEQMWVISDDHDGAVAKALVGTENADALFENAETIQIHIPEYCEIHEIDMDKWAEMIQRFDPDLQTPTLVLPGGNGKRVLYIVQKVLLVSHIKITASYKAGDATLLELVSADPPSQGVNLDAHFRTMSSGSVVGEFTLSAAQKNQKLPVAFSGFRYAYDKFGNRDVDGRETQSEADGEIGESSAAASEEEDDSQAEEEELEEDAQVDEHMGDFVADDWFATVLPCSDPSQLEILPRIDEEEEEADHAGEGQDEVEPVVDQDRTGVEDID